MQKRERGIDAHGALNVDPAGDAVTYRQPEHDEVDVALNRWRESGFRNMLFADEMRARMMARLEEEAREARATIERLRRSPETP